MNMCPLLRNSTEHYSKDFCNAYYLIDVYVDTIFLFLLISCRYNNHSFTVKIDTTKFIIFQLNSNNDLCLYSQNYSRSENILYMESQLFLSK